MLDFVLMIDVLEHLSFEQGYELLTKLRKLLNPGGGKS